MLVFWLAAHSGLKRNGRLQNRRGDPRSCGLGLNNLERQTNALVATLAKQPSLLGVSSQFRANTPELFMDIDRAKTAALGVPFTDVNQTLGIYLGSLYVNSFNVLGRHWQVNAQALGDYRQKQSNTNLLEVRNPQGEMVPLGTLAANAIDRRADLCVPLQFPRGDVDFRRHQAWREFRERD